MSYFQRRTYWTAARSQPAEWRASKYWSISLYRWTHSRLCYRISLVPMTLLTSHSLPIRPTRPASQVTPSGLPTSGADESIQEEGSATYIDICPVNGCSVTLTIWPHPGIYTFGPAHEAGLSTDAWEEAHVIAYVEPWLYQHTLTC